jgi:hypothetical protein
VRGRGAVGDYLSEIFEDFVPRRPGRSKVLWDLAAIARLACPDALPVVLRASPLLNDNFTYSHDPRRHQIQVAWHANRDKIFTDFFALLT